MNELRWVDAFLGQLEAAVRDAYWYGYRDGLLTGACAVLALVVIAWLIGGRR